MKNSPIKKPSQDDYRKTSLRLPQDLHATLASAAEYHGHSLNAEILSRLQATPLIDLVETLVRDNAELKIMVRELLDLADRK